jgi:hypothetical protein
MLLPAESSWPACSPDLSPIEQIWGFIKHQIKLEGAKTSEDLFDRISAIWDSIEISTINNFINSLKPRIWTMEDLDGHAITGRNDMIRIYQEHGIAGRPNARSLKNNGCVSSDWVNTLRTVARETLKKLEGLELAREMQDLLAQLHEAADQIYINLPGHR